ncbi:hypothetical protein K6V78_06650 [Streptococcus gallolyticus]|nr:hypothetical protein [Streptococcus gallolyticus]MBY5041819.1 hypothetical protein [Streptococcus gallolyticus]
MKKRIMVIGPNDKDKEKIIELIEGESNLPHVQSMVYLDKTIQVPSSYLRGSGMMKHIIATQQNASAILMILSADRAFPVYSPNFAKVFRIPTIGLVLTRNDPSQEIGRLPCRRELEEAKVDIILVLDLENDEQCQQLLHTITLLKKE